MTLALIDIFMGALVSWFVMDWTNSIPTAILSCAAVGFYGALNLAEGSSLK